ncbi:MAG: histidinol-phosphate transaminase [Rhodobacteraceae bacterium]|nr:histidinol-phosphate transaminase [Paracoccaceae bacterium]
MNSIATPSFPLARSGVGRIGDHMKVTEAAWPPPLVALNSNENAFGPSPYAVEAAQSAATRLERYVENQHHILAPVIASHHGLDAERIAVGCGSDDLLVRLTRCYLEPGRELLRAANSYPKVPNYAHACDAIPVDAPSSGYAAEVDSMLRLVSKRTRIVYIASPDNPSSVLMPASEIRRLHRGLPSQVLLIVDGAYLEYTDRCQEAGLFELVAANQNVVLTRTFSKIHGLAAARVGWMYGPRRIVGDLTRLQMKFPMAVPSLHAAIAALDDKRHTAFVRSETLRLRQLWTNRLSRLGIGVQPSQSNFLLMDFRETGRDATSVLEELQGRGIYVRQFLLPALRTCLRLTLGRERQLERFGSALADILENPGGRQPSL